MKKRAGSAAVVILFLLGALTVVWMTLAGVYVFATQYAFATPSLMLYAAIASSAFTVWFKKSEARMAALRATKRWTIKNLRVRSRLLWESFVKHLRTVRQSRDSGDAPSAPRLAQAA